MKKELQNYLPICEAIGKLFYPNVEVVMHDLLSKKIAYISNAFSKRRVGDKMINDLENLESIKEDFVGPYEKRNDDGKRLKAVTIIIRDDKSSPVGMICINYNVENISSLIDSLQTLVSNETSTQKRPATLFSQNWKEHTDQTIERFLKEKNVSLSALKMQEKRELVYYLQKEGIFDIRNAITYVCEVMDISKATVYNWLKQDK